MQEFPADQILAPGYRPGIPVTAKSTSSRRRVPTIFPQPRLSGGTIYRMNQDDPEQRIAELEQQLAEARGGYPRQADPEGFGGQADSGPFEPAFWKPVPRPLATERNWVLWAIGLFGLPIGAVGCWIAAAFGSAVFPSSVQWMNGTFAATGTGWLQNPPATAPRRVGRGQAGPSDASAKTAGMKPMVSRS